MTGAVPGMYGDLSDEQRVLYGRWMMALFPRAEHVDHCPFSCRDDLAACSDGKYFVAAEQQRWREWDAARPAEVTSHD